MTVQDITQQALFDFGAMIKEAEEENALSFGLCESWEAEAVKLAKEAKAKKAEKKAPYKARIFYEEVATEIKQENRENANKSSLALIEAGQLADFEKKAIFKTYTGRGGLHGVEFKGWEHFREYTEEKQAQEAGQFFTPPEVCKNIVEILEIEEGAKVGDITCGSGNFFNFLKGCEIHGADIDPEAVKVARALYPEAKIQVEDLKYFSTHKTFDYIVGNPPFNLVFEGRHCPELASEGGSLKSQNLFIYKAEKNLKKGGFLAFVCPETFLNDPLTHKKINEFLENNFVKCLEKSLDSRTFKRVGIDNFKTKILIFQKKIEGVDLENWDEIPLFLAKNKGITQEKILIENKKKAKAWENANKLLKYKEQAEAREDERKEGEAWKKLLFEVRRIDGEQARKFENWTPKEPEPESWHFEKFNQYTEAREEWKKRNSKKAIMRKMEKFISQKPEKDLIKIVKSKKKIWLKGYSRKARAVLKSTGQETEWETNKLFQKDHFPEEWETFKNSLAYMYKTPLFYQTEKESQKIEFKNFSVKSFFKRKQKKIELWRKPIEEIQDENTKKWLQKMEFGKKKLYPHQIEDISRALAKPSALLNWEMGTGKTLSAYAWAKIRSGKTLIIAPALLINKTWREELEESGENNFVIIEKFKSLENLEKGKNFDFVLISLERMPKFYKRLKKIKFDNLIIDESDNIKTKGSTRAKAVKTIARKIKNKLLLTGTFTRNNAVEAYNQLELLLNNSQAFLCEVQTVLEYDKSDKEYTRKRNENFMLPYKAHGGHSLFRKNFSPKKTTVFGGSKTNQELYNKYELEKILKQVRLRRRFTEVASAKYEIKQVLVNMSEGEKELYKYIFSKFAEEIQKMYEEDGRDSRQAKMLVIMRQIMALLQAVSHPWTFPEYSGGGYTSKMEKTVEIIRESGAKKIMFGTPWKPTAEKYKKVLADRLFGEYKIFFIDSEMTINQRNGQIKAFREYSASKAVLVSTTGVLKAGVNIPEAEAVIVDSYPWNYAQLSQYFFRAIRLNSQTNTKIYCLSNLGSFDTNVFNLMIAKERVNNFIQDGEENETGELAESLGADEDIMQTALQMVKEECDGKTRSSITWGENVLTDETARAEK